MTAAFYPGNRLEPAAEPHRERFGHCKTVTQEGPCDYRDNGFERFYPVKTSDGRFDAAYARYEALTEGRQARQLYRPTREHNQGHFWICIRSSANAEAAFTPGWADPLPH